MQGIGRDETQYFAGHDWNICMKDTTDCQWVGDKDNNGYYSDVGEKATTIFSFGFTYLGQRFFFCNLSSVLRSVPLVSSFEMFIRSWPKMCSYVKSVVGFLKKLFGSR